MKDIFVARQPIFNRQIEVIGYELLYRASGTSKTSGAHAQMDGDRLTIDVILNTFMEIGLDQLVGDKIAFINFTQNFFLDKYPIPFPPDQVVIEVLEDIPVDNNLVLSLQKFSEQGFKIALDDVVSLETISPLLNMVDLVKIDVMAMEKTLLPQVSAYLKRFGVRLLAEKVETKSEFKFCRQLGFDYFQGYFLSKPDVVAGRKLDHSRLTLLQMLAELNHPEMDYRRLEFIVSQDSSLSYKLLRLINSAHFGLRVEISGIHQALTLLGVQQIQGWLSLLLMTDTSDKPVELMNIACIRSKMCELIAKRMSITKTEPYFMVGLLSSLDAIMDLSMDRLLESLPVTAEIKKALLAYEGHLGVVLRSVLAYERGLWDEAILPGFQPSMLFDIYLDSVEWATKTTDGLMKSLDESPAKK